MTDSEQALWARLRRKQLRRIQFYRQKPVGEFIVDFFAPKAKLVIEIDGSQHLTPTSVRRDEKRSAALQRQGLRILRFTNLQVLQELDSVIEAIYQALADPNEQYPQPPLCQMGELTNYVERPG